MEQRSKVYSELYAILKDIDKVKVMKIPNSLLREIIDNRDKDYVFNIDWDKPLLEQGISMDAINILGYINLNYWASTDEEKRRLREKFKQNKVEFEKSKNLQESSDVKFESNNTKALAINQNNKINKYENKNILVRIVIALKNLFSKKKSLK